MLPNTSARLAITVWLLLTMACSAPAEIPKATSQMVHTAFVAQEAEAPPQATPRAPAAADRPRKRIVTGTLELIHDAPLSLQSPIQARLEALEGWVASARTEEDWLQMSLRVPVDLLQPLLEFLEGLARVDSKSLETTDITQSYYDLQTRIENQQALVARLRRYLNEARSIEDILAVESKLAETTAHLESLLAQRLTWDREVAYSRIELTVRAGAVGRVDWPDLGRGFQEFGVNLVWLLYFLFFGLLYLLVIGAPVAGLAVGMASLIRTIRTRRGPPRGA